MATEIEAKFLNVDHDTLREKLQAIGAKIEQPMRLMHRVILDYPDGKLKREHAWARVRHEGDKVTLTYKCDSEKSFGSVKEVEVTVDSYENAVELLISLGLRVLSSQESRRETWHIDEVEVVLDDWPWVPAFVEIEAQTKEAVKTVSEKLGFEWGSAVFGSVTNVYRANYPKIDKSKDIGIIPIIAFNAEPPSWFGKAKDETY